MVFNDILTCPASCLFVFEDIRSLWVQFSSISLFCVVETLILLLIVWITMLKLYLAKRLSSLLF